MAPPPAAHDQATAVPDQDPTASLAAALNGLRLTGALFLHARYTEGWAYRSAPVSDIASLFAPGARALVLFHLVSEGRCWVSVGEGDKHWAEAGDVIVLPYGDVHAMGGTRDATIVDVGTLITPPPWDDMPFIQHGDGGDATHVICGYMQSPAPLFDPAIGAFPPVFVVRPTGQAAKWIRASIDYAAGQTTRDTTGTFGAPTTVPEIVLTEVLKIHLASAPAAERGFIRALHDPVIAAAMARIHADPAQKWTVADLAAAGNVSVSLLDERFRTALGMPPIRYLTSWRMHVAQDLLTSTDLGVAAIAHRVGYESEEAFSRAFKRKHDLAPSMWRSR